jgi:hypothetical protein
LLTERKEIGRIGENEPSPLGNKGNPGWIKAAAGIRDKGQELIYRWSRVSSGLWYSGSPMHEEGQWLNGVERQAQ